MSAFIGRKLSIYLALICAVVLIVEYFVKTGTNAGAILNKWAVDIVAWTTILGFITANRTHIETVMKRGTRWWLSAWLVALLWIMTIVGFTAGMKDPIFLWLSQNVMIASYSGIMSVSGLFILPAAYRAFRARNLESGLLLIVGILVIFGNVTIGEAAWPGITGLRTWLLDVPVAASQRGILMAAAIGFIGILTRAVIGIETNWLGVEEKP